MRYDSQKPLDVVRVLLMNDLILTAEQLATGVLDPIEDCCAAYHERRKPYFHASGRAQLIKAEHSLAVVSNDERAALSPYLDRLVVVVPRRIMRISTMPPSSGIVRMTDPPLGITWLSLKWWKEDMMTHGAKV